ncbi:MAG: hypothetical protein LW817_02090 [Candidatus Caenarcaniphilales bacterium]|jgi:hypothetical protein|nr:hypothetical protein [Candidatus Caenarcaniphilales bacterium]
MTRLYILLIFGFLLINPSLADGLSGHSIKNLSVTSDPSNLSSGDQAKLNISFRLRSTTGVDVNRIKVFADTTSITPATSNITLTSVSSDANSQTYDVKILIDNLSIGDKDINLKIEYWLTRSNGNPPMASEKVLLDVQSSSGNNNNGSGSNNGSGNSNGGTSNGSVTLINKIIDISVEVFNGSTTESFVSTSPRKLLLTAKHDLNVIDYITKNNFNAATDIILSNLKIKATNFFSGDKKQLDYDFSVYQDSVLDSSNPKYLITKFITDELVFTDAEQIKFSIDLNDFIEKTQLKINGSYLASDAYTYTFKALTANLNTLAISDSNIEFNSTGLTRKSLNLASETVNFTSNIKAADSLFNGEVLEIKYQGKFNRKTRKALLQVGKKKFTLKPSLASAASFSSATNGTNLTLPISFTLKANQKMLQKTFNGSTASTLTVPFFIHAKTAQDLDYRLRGLFIDSTNVLINFPEN